MVEADAPRKRARGGGGAARRAARGAVSFETAKYIERNIPNFDVLTEEALEIIETNAETVLEEIGVNFVNNPRALELWKAAGAEVVGERVRIPRGLARKAQRPLPGGPKIRTDHNRANGHERNLRKPHAITPELRLRARRLRRHTPGSDKTRIE